MKTQRTLLALFLAIHSIASNGANAQGTLHNTISTCLSQSHNELEETYCKIQAKNPNHNLPSFNDFQNNPPKMQYLLLKGPARKLNIQLPKPARSKSPKTAQAAGTKNLKAQEKLVKKLTPTIRSNIASPNIPKTQDPQPHNSSKKMQHCKLDKLWIHCNEMYYKLVTNKKNTELEKNALNESNKMHIQDRDSEAFSGVSNIKYLSKTYPIYINKMLSIGLGAGTMSFTRYASIYEVSEKNQQNFSERMETMFGFLKTDKRGNAIKSRYDALLPADIESCMPLDDNLIVCDNVNKNWVYKIANKE